jgi:transcriptional regulator with XRE-family HTH domain
MKYGYLDHNLKLLRTDRKISAIRLSEELNMSINRIADIEYSKKRLIAIEPEEIKAIADYFDIPIDTLLNKKAYVAFE